MHDEMFFGDSKECTGIQMADLCSLFIRTHLSENANPDSEGFYHVIEPRIFFGEVEPK